MVNHKFVIIKIIFSESDFSTVTTNKATLNILIMSAKAPMRTNNILNPKILFKILTLLATNFATCSVFLILNFILLLFFVQVDKNMSLKCCYKNTHLLFNTTIP